MKILYFNHTGTVSGAERVLLTTLAGANPRRFEKVLLCPEEGELAAMARGAGTRVRTLPALRARFTWRPDRLLRYAGSSLGVIRALRRRIIEEAPDLIHANSIRAGLAATAATMGLYVPVLWHLHDMLPRHPLSTLIRWYATLTSRARVLAPSRAVLDGFRGGLLGRLGWGRDRARVVYNGIDPRRFVRDEDAARRVRDELGLPANGFVVGIVGQINPRKGQLELIEAFAEAALPDSALLIVGAPLFNDDQRYLARLKRRARDLGMSARVRFAGSREDIAVVMSSLDLLVLNSRREPFGLVIVEAMACGAPVLATAVDGVVEIVEHDRTGWLIPPASPAALTAALRRLHADAPLRRRLADAATARALPRFTADAYVRGVEAYYRHGLPEKGLREATKLASNAPESEI